MKLQNIEFILSNISGNWISQRTTYSIKTQEIKIAKLQNKIELIKSKEINKKYTNKLNYLISYYYQCYPINEQKIIYNYYITHTTPLFIQGIIRKEQKNVFKEYNFIFKKRYLKVTHSDNKINYTEYIYFINSKFYMSIILIKSNNSYVAISFHSDIKINIKS